MSDSQIPDAYRSRAVPLTPPDQRVVDSLKGCRQKIDRLAQEMFGLESAEAPKPHQVQAALARLRNPETGASASYLFCQAKEALEQIREAIPVVKKSLSRGDTEALDALSFLHIGARTAKGLNAEFVLMNTAIELNTKTGELLYPGTSYLIQGIQGVESGQVKTGQLEIESGEVHTAEGFEIAHTFRVGCAQIGAVQASVDHVTLATLAVKISKKKRDLRNCQLKLAELESPGRTSETAERLEIPELRNTIKQLSMQIEILRHQRDTLVKSTALLDCARWALVAGTIPPAVSATAAAAIGAAALGHVGFGALMGAVAIKKISEAHKEKKQAQQETAFLSRSEKADRWERKGSPAIQKLKEAMRAGRLDQLEHATKKRLKSDILRNGLLLATSGTAFTSGALTIGLVLGATLSTAVALTGIGIVVLTAATLLVGVATFLYRRRKSIIAGIQLKTSFKWQEAKLQKQIRQGGPAADEARKKLSDLQLKVVEAERVSKAGINLLKARFSRWKARRRYNKTVKAIEQEQWAGADLDRRFEKALEKVTESEKLYSQCKAIANEVSALNLASKKELAYDVQQALDEIDDPKQALAELAIDTPGFSDVSGKAQSMLSRPGDMKADLKRLAYGFINGAPRVRE